MPFLDVHPFAACRGGALPPRRTLNERSGWSMKVRKTLTLLGLVTVGQHAIAHAHTTDEQRFQLGGVEVSLGLGLLNGQAQEKVYDTYDGQKVS